MGLRDRLPTREVLSDPTEWHGLTHGVFKGFFGLSPKPKAPDAREELHYYRFGYLVGWFAKLGLVLLLGTKVQGMVIA